MCVCVCACVRARARSLARSLARASVYMMFYAATLFPSSNDYLPFVEHLKTPSLASRRKDGS